MKLLSKTTLPIVEGVSKNRTHIKKKNGICLAPESRRAKLLWTALIKEGCVESVTSEFEKPKVFLKIKYFRKDYRSDPINIIDLLADAARDAVGIDDRYFELSLEWEEDKANPRIEVEVFLKNN